MDMWCVSMFCPVHVYSPTCVWDGPYRIPKHAWDNLLSHTSIFKNLTICFFTEFMTTQDSYCTFIVLSYVDNNGETVQVVTCNELATSVKTRVSILAFGRRSSVFSYQLHKIY